ncbi:MAG: hypothetical protein NC213_03470 [Acetobacter sp.]|nr:hypothetical protein [Bacteroides sp.]MCM1340783.1 hypothetical protein [Acetobacter sp.]MCM1432660.1 hypothetical protein [Clostridiales bacterium]
MPQKVLPYKIPKMMLTYPYNAFYFGILEANNIDYTDVILNDFLELYYFKKSAIHKIDFRNSGMFEFNRFNSIEFPDTNNIIETIKKYIDDGYYAILMLNQKYFQNEKVHTSWERNHDWLIYGYNDTTMSFYCSSYIGSKDKEVFGNIELSYLEIESALRHTLSNYIKPSPSYFRNHFIKINTNWNEPKITKDILYYKIKRMFFPKHSARDGYWHPVAGIYSLDKLLRKIKKVNIVKNKRKTIFIQNIRIIYEFRQNVLLCLKRMDINQLTINQYEEIVTSTYKILLLSFKYNLTKNRNTLNNIYKKLQQENKTERKLLKHILKNYNPKKKGHYYG